MFKCSINTKPILDYPFYNSGCHLGLGDTPQALAQKLINLGAMGLALSKERDYAHWVGFQKRGGGTGETRIHLDGVLDHVFNQRNSETMQLEIGPEEELARMVAEIRCTGKRDMVLTLLSVGMILGREFSPDGLVFLDPSTKKPLKPITLASLGQMEALPVNKGFWGKFTRGNNRVYLPKFNPEELFVPDPAAMNIEDLPFPQRVVARNEKFVDLVEKLPDDLRAAAMPLLPVFAEAVEMVDRGVGHDRLGFFSNRQAVLIAAMEDFQRARTAKVQIALKRAFDDTRDTLSHKIAAARPDTEGPQLDRLSALRRQLS